MNVGTWEEFTYFADRKSYAWNNLIGQRKDHPYLSAVTPQQYGGAVNATGDDANAVASAEAAGDFVYLSYDTKVSTAAAALNGVFFGQGQIIDGSSNRRGRVFSAISTAPASFGNQTSVDTTFNGDLTKQYFNIEHRITGADTLGTAAQISTDIFRQKLECGPFFMKMYNESGRSDNASNGTGVAGIYIDVANASPNGGWSGGLTLNSAAYAARTPTGAFDRTAIGCASGQTVAAVSSVYLNTLEFLTNDNGNDVTGIGLVLRFARTVSTATNGAFWRGIHLSASDGTQPVDEGICFIGKYTNGIDFTQATCTQNIVMKVGQRIHFNATAGTLPKGASSAGTTYIEYNNAAAKVVVAVGGTNSLQVDSAGFVYGLTGFAVAGTQVVSARNTGWTNQTAVASKADLGATPTVGQLASWASAIDAMLKAHGLTST